MPPRVKPKIEAKRKTAKKLRSVRPVKEVVFDDAARACVLSGSTDGADGCSEYLTGFSKRKQERKAKARQTAEAREHAERLEIRRSVRQRCARHAI